MSSHLRRLGSLRSAVKNTGLSDKEGAFVGKRQLLLYPKTSTAAGHYTKEIPHVVHRLMTRTRDSPFILKTEFAIVPHRVFGTDLGMILLSNHRGLFRTQASRGLVPQTLNETNLSRNSISSDVSYSKETPALCMHIRNLLADRSWVRVPAIATFSHVMSFFSRYRSCQWKALDVCTQRERGG